MFQKKAKLGPLSIKPIFKKRGTQKPKKSDTSSAYPTFFIIIFTQNKQLRIKYTNNLSIDANSTAFNSFKFSIFAPRFISISVFLQKTSAKMKLILKQWNGKYINS
jgi:hypothetical protein